MINTERSIEQIGKLRQFLPENTNEELDDILAYGEEMRKEWLKKKQNFWSNHDGDDFKKLLRYKRKHEDELVLKYKYLDRMNELERKKFVEEYLYNDVLYGWNLEEKSSGRKIEYWKWKNWFVELEEWSMLALWGCEIWVEWVKRIVEELELKEWVMLNLWASKLWDEWAKIISKIELKSDCSLWLDSNNIWVQWMNR